MFLFRWRKFWGIQLLIYIYISIFMRLHSSYSLVPIDCSVRTASETVTPQGLFFFFLNSAQSIFGGKPLTWVCLLRLERHRDVWKGLNSAPTGWMIRRRKAEKLPRGTQLQNMCTKKDAKIGHVRFFAGRKILGALMWMNRLFKVKVTAHLLNLNFRELLKFSRLYFCWRSEGNSFNQPKLLSSAFFFCHS